MVAGLWTIIFNLMGEKRSVTMTIKGTQITGGNTEYYYVGELQITGNSLAGNLVGHHYFGSRDHLLGNPERIALHMKATISDQKITGEASIDGTPIHIPFVGAKRA
jgi:hypothetical protein